MIYFYGALLAATIFALSMLILWPFQYLWNDQLKDIEASKARIKAAQERIAERKANLAPTPPTSETDEAFLHRLVQNVVARGGLFATEVEREYRAHVSRRIEEMMKDPSTLPPHLKRLHEAGERAVAEWRASKKGRN